MVKGNPKSSASSGTRKKHQKKHAAADEPQPHEKRSKKDKKKEPRVKMYIPPVKPAPVQPDPLETTGLAHTLPADLLVVLRNISKKAQVTKTRALEELQTAWVNQCLADGPSSPLLYPLVEMLPVWLHHVSALFVNPSRRVRLLAASLHSVLLQIPPIRDEVLAFLRDRASESQLESILGTWCLATQDVDRQVAISATKSWKEAIVLDGSVSSSAMSSSAVASSAMSSSAMSVTEDARASLNSFVQRTILDPAGIYAYLNPSPPPPPPPPSHPNKKGGKATGKATLPAQTRKDDGDATPRSKLDEQEESDTDRHARLRIAGLGVARTFLGDLTTLSEDLRSFYSNAALWTILHPKETCPWVDVECFGYAQPNVRKAGWNLLQALIKLPKESIDPLAPVIGTAVLRSAWVETDSLVQGVMWPPLLVFLKQYPSCWLTDAASSHDGRDDGSEPDSNNEGEDDKTHLVISKENVSSEAYDEFVQFLDSGCSGSPAQGYPTVVVVLSTIPSSVIASRETDPSTPFGNLFLHFWSATSSRALSALHRVSVSAAFLSSLLECMVLLVKRLQSDTARETTDFERVPKDYSETFVREQFSKIWSNLANGTLKVEDRAAARLLAQTLDSLLPIDDRVLDAAWNEVALGVAASSNQEEQARLGPVLLKVFYDRFRKTDSILKDRGRDLMMAALVDALNVCEQHLVSGGDALPAAFSFLVNVVDQFREGLFFDDVFSRRLDEIVVQYAYRILALSAPLLLSYLQYRKSDAQVLDTWHSLLTSIASASAHGTRLDQKAIAHLLSAVQKGTLPSYLKPRDGELDALVGTVLEQALDGPIGSENFVLSKQILVSSGYFLSSSAKETFLQIITATFTDNVEALVNGEDISSPVIFDVTISLIQATFGALIETPGLEKSIVPSVFIFSYILSLQTHGDATGPSPAHQTGISLWQDWLKSGSEDSKSAVMDAIRTKLKDIMQSTDVHLSPEDLLNKLFAQPPGLQIDLLKDVFPPRYQLDADLEKLSGSALDYSIAVLDPLIPSTASSKTTEAATTDRRGFSRYARVVSAMIVAFLEDRQLAKHNLWAFRHFFALSIYAQDLLNVTASAARSPVFDDKVTLTALSDIVNRVKQLSVYVLRSAADKDSTQWRSNVLERLLLDEATKKPPTDTNAPTSLQDLIFDVVTGAKNGDTVRDCRILKLVLEPLLIDDLHPTEADKWVQLSRKYEKSAPQTSMTLISIITTSGAEPPKLDRYRNELAANLMGIPARKANTEGLLTLRRLSSAAPDPESTVIFLPPPRAVNVIKACQAWVTTDDDVDLDDDLESAMLPIFMHLAPILQNVPGSHWGFIFDLVESTIEQISPSEEDDDEEDESPESRRLVALARVSKLVTVLEDLAKTNKSLMAEWSERRLGILTSIRDLKILGNDLGIASSVPRSMCRELVLSIVQHLPSSLIDQGTLPKMCHLIEDVSPSVQQMAYQLLKTAARKRTEHFVIEAGVDSEAVVQATIPIELMDIIQREMHFRYNPDAEDDSHDREQNMFGYLLGWMLIFDLFQDASFKVRSSYIEQLRNENVVLSHFIPCFLGTLGLDQGALSKAFKLDMWGIDQFFVELYQPGSPHTIPVFTAHVFYRALLAIPSLIHGWVLDCKDRQLTNTVTSYTSTHFSPVLIRAELNHVQTHATADGLADDSLSIKVATAVNEVVAAYSVDEHQLEIKLRIPVDWPLHRIEVKDVKRVGVDENRWRAWVLGVQQTIWAHNGRIIDGLGLFKKNVTLHFEGQVECAICYSIISVMDSTLPKKPCKTCKNRFHAGCLYKWFNTSHSSSCPLCRSDII